MTSSHWALMKSGPLYLWETCSSSFTRTNCRLMGRGAERTSLKYMNHRTSLKRYCLRLHLQISSWSGEQISEKKRKKIPWPSTRKSYQEVWDVRAEDDRWKRYSSSAHIWSRCISGKNRCRTLRVRHDCRERQSISTTDCCRTQYRLCIHQEVSFRRKR